MQQLNSDGLRVVTLNIDWNKNLSRVLPFLSDCNADVTCLQEVCADAIPVLQEAAGAQYVYAPMCGGKIHGAPETVGIAIFSHLPLLHTEAYYYAGRADNILELDEQTFESRRTTTCRVLAVGDVRKNGIVYRIATTHFTWTPDGRADECQRRDLRKMLNILERAGECVLCGDFNAPRGGEVYGILSRRFKDNIPAIYVTSIDPELHRIRGLLAMVDGVFSTPAYAVSQVTMRFGLSDHGALKATVFQE